MISFIILHYKNLEETIKCLDSINIIKNKNDSIIVVDNNTMSKEDEKIIRKYTNDLVLLDKNYGFAKGNNNGIEYAKKKYDSDFYVVINNDVIIEQKDFIDIIKSDYKKYHFDMLGPRIESNSGESVNPFNAYVKKEDIINEISKCKKLKRIYSSILLNALLVTYLNIKYIFMKKKIGHNGKAIEKNVALHGCAIIFSKKYINKYKYPFYNDTFLFHEEEFLYQRVLKDKLISLYDPNIYIYHKESASMKNNRKSKLFKVNERIKSLNLLLSSMEGNNER